MMTTIMMIMIMMMMMMMMMIMMTMMMIITYLMSAHQRKDANPGLKLVLRRTHPHTVLEIKRAPGPPMLRDKGNERLLVVLLSIELGKIIVKDRVCAP